MVVPKAWHETHRALPGRFVVKIGWTRALKNSKSREGDEAGCCALTANGGGEQTGGGQSEQGHTALLCDEETTGNIRAISRLA